ncbi:unnamed protein product [Rotaria sordida]|uniref:C2H2-type domain-containing protein n=1 Tax=Rotaria sordida TaxID=392033 RepID=A0A813PB00_9BILA|nr:unnamed protein product [Rotaria sordida]CAF0788650.1 unnamed protein product [Rotaria sordida]CAF0853369.1 unnamed protein product [Rotaria sordida]CAF3653467.1 unnamed protein product [Rotaria sordida]
MIVTQILTDDEDNNNTNDDSVLDLSFKKKSSINNEIILKQNQNLSSLLSPPSSTSSSSFMISPKQNHTTNKRILEIPNVKKSKQTGTIPSNKRPLRFQCKHCDYKAPSTSLMQNHIYRHTDLTPYACAYCGHKSTTKSTIMVHIELCHPNMEVKINENRVREQDFYRDLNSSEITSLSNPNTSTTTTTTTTTTPTTITNDGPQIKKPRRSNQYDSESEPINGVAISLKTIGEDENESSHASDDTSETENLEPILFDDDEQQQTDTNIYDASPTMAKPSLKLKFSSQQIPIIESSTTTTKESDCDDDSEYLLVYNRPKQYYGSLYEPDKQYACKLCSYTTNHRPSMEDHVFVHTDEKPYKCGYCGEEIFTRYAATYHIKYKHAGMARNFIQNKADVTQYYVNRAKRDDEKNQFKVIDTRRVKVPTRNGKSVNNQNTKIESPIERPIQHVSSPSPSNVVSSTPPQTSTSSSNNSQIPTAPPDYRFLLAWSYYLASQAAWLSPMLQQQGQIPPSLTTDPEATAKFLQQAMQTVMEPLITAQTSNNNNNTNEDDNNDEQTENELESENLVIVKDETNEY